MKLYFAPMEGITGYIFRTVFAKHFGGADQYYSPFLAPVQDQWMTNRERGDVLPEHNEGIRLVPQIMANRASVFLGTARVLAEMGYQEVNFNCGCPSGTVVAKGKGAGMLRDLDGLRRFLEEACAHAPMEISIKTRLGMREPEEVFDLMEVLQDYPLKEWILHARVREDYYKNQPRRDIFKEVAKECKLPLCYNGDICTVEDFKEMKEMFPQLSGMMIGRGALLDPSLFRRIRGGCAMEKREFAAFHEELCARYEEYMSGDRNTLFKMKELWAYWAYMFPDSSKALKKIRKANSLKVYRQEVEQLLEEN
ncbi:tRNA-dihydrouridine synthase family protein [Anaerotignum lactatifermentans]|uniref:tRNA-dihydrouridine synthase n=1 Tax=Anaerotignum lactatifermentans TaxID=160404 RepID=A0ABS2GBR1_9FIRM|nr:tRNA-dihydrouridine synthase family protein [Anaerotignum lactatifermentans]MBM6828566.1 tRNA-dihydrouridine synthase family protein [Anaerotignum lactatifermentans]MBM6877973.1 tRNA-dihydrouridine synthase family protein [Anaerotignum lactatifermentans]MBM6950148.1 tRNA-dihydrouridine synthase family protein [Anaerotignum lactatifermentans]